MRIKDVIVEHSPEDEQNTTLHSLVAEVGNVLGGGLIEFDREAFNRGIPLYQLLMEYKGKIRRGELP